MSDILLHANTRIALERLSKSGAHALLFTGDQGAGKYTVAVKFIEEMLNAKADMSPYILIVSPSGKAIGIEQIRELQKFLQLKTTGKTVLRRAVLVDSADTMTIEAQNALLKVLEEPPEDTVIVLTASRPHQLKPTIHSRVQTVAILQPPKSDVVDYFLKQGYEGAEIERAFMLSNGQVGLLNALLGSDSENTLVAQIDTAKKLYGMSAFERLTKVDELSKDREALANLLFACKRICTSALEQAALKQQQANIKAWHKQLSLIINAEESLRFTPNTKLLLTDLFISM